MHLSDSTAARVDFYVDPLLRGWPRESSRGLLAAALTVCQHRVATVIIIV